MVCFERVSPTLLMCRGDVADCSITLKKSLRYFWGRNKVKNMVKTLLGRVGEDSKNVQAQLPIQLSSSLEMAFVKSPRLALLPSFAPRTQGCDVHSAGAGDTCLWLRALTHSNTAFRLICRQCPEVFAHGSAFQQHCHYSICYILKKPFSPTYSLSRKMNKRAGGGEG